MANKHYEALIFYYGARERSRCERCAYFELFPRGHNGRCNKVAPWSRKEAVWSKMMPACNAFVLQREEKQEEDDPPPPPEQPSLF